MAVSETPVETSCIALNYKRDVTATMPWFAGTCRHPPRACNVVHPLINGERAFAAVHDAIAGAKKSVELVLWGFDPSMRLRPGGERVGALLKRKAAAGVQIRMLVWKNALANFLENNIIGDGLLGSGGTALGSRAGSTSRGDAAPTPRNGNNGYGSPKSGSGGVMAGDPEAQAFNRAWFATKAANLSFYTRDFDRYDRAAILGRQANRGAAQSSLLTAFPSHHQKTILVDYENPEEAVGFVMGHNMLRDYWDTDAHEYVSAARLGFGPWQDLSTRVYGGVLYDINENFTRAWERAQPWIGGDMPLPAGRMSIKPSAFEPAARKRGTPEMAQICRTQAQEDDRSILESYKLALANARRYVYIENQYFRNTELAMHLRQVRRRLKAEGWKRDLYVFVVTNVPDDSGRLNTYQTLRALGKAERMPEIDKKNDGAESKGDSAALRRKDLEGLNIHVCTLCTSGTEYTEAAVSYGGGTGPMGLPSMSVAPPVGYTAYKPIYVHSKLLLVDDVFFTLGSANVNVRSMEVDSEINIAMPSPEVTAQWRRHLWGIHTGRAPGDDPAREFVEWGKIMDQNGQAKKDGSLLSSHLVEFYDDEKSGSGLD